MGGQYYDLPSHKMSKMEQTRGQEGWEAEISFSLNILRCSKIIKKKYQKSSWTKVSGTRDERSECRYISGVIDSEEILVATGK